ncbi:MAG: gliding motility-associated C-terminal domain-containing protein, partial [Bacteroidetes bacterium]|nr:gliding motility-associated C-terminal domain-containing protein [Bacteroidota bacterium]
GVSGLTAVTTAASDATLCFGEQVALSAAITSSAPYSISWSPANVIANPGAAQTNATPTGTTAFVCTVTDTQTGCTASSSTTVNVSPQYTLQMPNDTTVCSALGMQLHFGDNLLAPFQIAWVPASHLNAANIAAPTIMVDTTTTYTVTVTDQNGCSVTDSVAIAVAFDNLITPLNVSACQGQPIVLNAGFPGSTYEWNTGDNTQTITVTQPGQYVATITDIQACQAIMTFNAAFNPLPVVNLGPDLALCGETSHLVDAGNAGNSVLWNTGTTGSQITVGASGTYSATATTPQGCSASDAVTIALNPMPVDVLLDVTVCESDPITLDAGNAGCTYQWSTGATTQAINPTSSGTYSATVTTPQNCSATFDAQVVLMPRISVDLGLDLVRCAGDTVVLNPGTMNTSFLWNTGATTQTLQVGATGTYILSATNGYCTDADTVAVTFNPVPTDNLSDQTACIGQTVVLDAGNAGAAYAWSNGAASQSISVAQSGQYAVSITGTNGCQANYAATVNIIPPPVVNLGADTVLCANQPLVLDAGNPGNTYAWNTGATGRTFAPTSSGTYAVTVDNGYCTTSDQITVIFNPIPEPMGMHQYFTCLDDDPHYVDIDAGNPGSTFLWADGQTTHLIHANSYGWHSVAITNSFGCSIADSAMVNEFCRPTLFIPNTFTPNGDGRNDVWLAVGNNVGFYEMYVFDRWGGVIFHTTDFSKGWDGTMDGNPVPNEVYAYRVVFRLIEDSSGKLGFEQTRMGHVQVLR